MLENLQWDISDTEAELLFGHLIDLAFDVDTDENEQIRNVLYHNKLLMKYFDHQLFKAEMLNEGWTILQSSKGYAIVKA